MLLRRRRIQHFQAKWCRDGRERDEKQMAVECAELATPSCQSPPVGRDQSAPWDTESDLRITIRACRHDGTAHAAPVLLPVLPQSSVPPPPTLPPPPPLPARPGVLASSFPPFFLLLVLLSASFMAQKKQSRASCLASARPALSSMLVLREARLPLRLCQRARALSADDEAGELLCVAAPVASRSAAQARPHL